MPEKTIKLTAPMASRLREAMAVLRINPKTVFESHSMQAAEDIAMLVEPLNADPYVFIPPATAHVFESQAGSGTDRLRQRMLASVFFADVIERVGRERAHAALRETMNPKGSVSTAWVEKSALWTVLFRGLLDAARSDCQASSSSVEAFGGEIAVVEAASEVNKRLRAFEKVADSNGSYTPDYVTAAAALIEAIRSDCEASNATRETFGQLLTALDQADVGAVAVAASVAAAPARRMKP
jgi:hypothetical protein